MITGARARDVQEPQLLCEAHLLVDRLVQLERVGLGLARELHLVRLIRREEHLHRAGAATRLRARSGEHDDRELETFGAVDRHDAHGVVVGLRQDRLDDPRAFGSLEGRPRQVVAQGSTRRVAEGARLVDHEPHPPRHIAEAARVDAHLEHVTIANDGFEQRARRHPGALRVQPGEEADRVAYRMLVRERFGQRPADVPTPPVLGVEREEIVVAAAEHR